MPLQLVSVELAAHMDVHPPITVVLLVCNQIEFLQPDTANVLYCAEIVNGLPLRDTGRRPLIRLAEQFIGEGTSCFTTTVPLMKILTTSMFMLLKIGVVEFRQITVNEEFALHLEPIPNGKGIMTLPHFS